MFTPKQQDRIIASNFPMFQLSNYYFNIALPSELLRKRTDKFLCKLNANCWLAVILLYSCLFCFLFIYLLVFSFFLLPFLVN